MAGFSDRRIRKIARDFTVGLLEDRSTKKQCFIVSLPLAGYLNFIGVECQAVEGLFDGWHHWWIVFPDGRVIDATASQFQGQRNYWLEHSPFHKEEKCPETDTLRSCL